MKNRNSKIDIIQAATVAVMSAAAAYTLYGHIGQVSIAVSIGLFLIGCLFIIYPRFNPLVYSVLVFLVCLPEFINHNVIDIGIRVFKGWDDDLRDFLFAKILPSTPVIASLLAGFLEITGCLILSHLHSLKKQYLSMTAANAEPGDADNMVYRYLTSMVQIVGLGLAASVATLALLVVFQTTLRSTIQNAPSGLVGLVLAAVIILTSFLYYVVRLKDSNKTK